MTAATGGTVAGSPERTNDVTTRSNYRLISADSHVLEPPDLWSSRVPEKYKDRAPRMERFDEGDAWVLEGVEDPINFGLNASAGMEPEKRKAWITWDEIRPGGHDPVARLSEQDEDFVDAEVLYPTPRLSQSLVANKDADFHLALVRAYNEWLSEFCSAAPQRLGGLAIIPNRGVDDAVAEIKRNLDQPGIVGFVMGCYPHGDLDIADEDDPVWATLEEAGAPVSIHVYMTNEMPQMHATKLPGDIRFYDVPKRILQFIHNGVLDRFADLRLVLAEVDCGWLPYFKEQADDRFRRQARAAGLELKELPSTYIERNCHFTYITDHYGVRNRADIGVDNMMWSSDFPHVGADWPNSWVTIAADFSGIPTEERDRILAGNAASLYGFGQS